jgi:hypothetical protein
MICSLCTFNYARLYRRSSPGVPSGKAIRGRGIPNRVRCEAPLKISRKSNLGSAIIMQGGEHVA